MFIIFGKEAEVVTFFWRQSFNVDFFMWKQNKETIYKTNRRIREILETFSLIRIIFIVSRLKLHRRSQNVDKNVYYVYKCLAGH